MTLENHLLLMVLYAGATAVFFALLWRETLRDRFRLFLIIFLGLFGSGILIALLMGNMVLG